MLKRKSSGTLIALLTLIVAQLACMNSGPRPPLVLYYSPTPNATQTPIIQTQVVAQTVVVAHPVTVVAHPTQASSTLCVTAQEAVNLRPSPSTDNYPVTILSHGQEVMDLGGRNGDWLFVQVGDKSGWIFKDYLGDCR